MSYADEVFIANCKDILENMCEDIINNGTTTEG